MTKHISLFAMRMTKTGLAITLIRGALSRIKVYMTVVATSVLMTNLLKNIWS